MARFITTYHRESRWVVDASHALAWLQEGGDRTVRFEWAPSWNTQPSGITLSVRLSNQGKGAAPREIAPLFEGGSISATFNDDRPPVEVEIPADANKVELVSIATGHGGESYKGYTCAEFCPHTHSFSVGGEVFAQELEIVDDAIRTNRQLLWAGLVQRHPDESEARLERRLLGLVLGEELATAAYGPLDDVP